MSLSEFHAKIGGDEETTSATSAVPSQGASQIVRMNWADEMEALDDGDAPQPSGQFVFDRSKLPTAPKSVRQSEIDMELIPKRPPFKAYLSNISFEADEDKIKNFFRDFKVMGVHLTVDQGGRSKGSGAIEFEDRDSLIAALGKNEAVFNNRPLRVSLMEPRTFGDRQGGGGGYMQRDDNEPLKSDESNWRREREPEPESSYGNRGGYGEQRPDRYQSGGDRDGDRRGGYGGRQQGGYGDRQQGGYGQSRGGYNDRRGGYGDNRGEGRGEGRGEERGEGRGGYGRRQEEGERRPYGGYNRGEQRERTEGDNPWTRSTEPARETPSESKAPELNERPKLQLQPRTLPVAEVGSSVPSSSIFGSAKPVNTAAREREIEEKLVKDKRDDNQEEAETKDENDLPHEQKKVSEQSRTSENPWKSRQSAELFNGQEASAETGRSNLYNTQTQRGYNDDRRGGYNKRPDSYSQTSGNRGYNRDGGNRGDRRGDSRGGYRQNDNRGGRNYSDKPERSYKPYNEQKANDDVPDIGINNKFAHLQVDVDEVE